MPDANGRVAPVAFSISPERWEHIFGGCDCEGPCDVCQESRCVRFGGEAECRCERLEPHEGEQW